MAGPNLEIFRFGLYVFFPIAIMLHYGNPDWYEKHVIPVSEGITFTGISCLKFYSLALCDWSLLGQGSYVSSIRTNERKLDVCFRWIVV